MKGLRKSAVIALLLSLAAGPALADITTLPPVRIHGVTIDNVEFKCRSLACADMLAGLGGVPIQEPLPLYNSIGSEGQIPAPKDLVCAILASQQPGGCEMSSPPSVPGFDAGWRPNGCGTGPMSNFFASAMMDVIFVDHFTGNLDAPFESQDVGQISFLSSCNNHDRCWASGYDRPNCDQSFRNDLFTQCAAITSPGEYNTCTGMASAYFAAVASDAATPHYQQADAQASCAAWVHYMNENGCQEGS